jgi:hypothetical protein
MKIVPSVENNSQASEEAIGISERKFPKKPPFIKILETHLLILMMDFS